MFERIEQGERGTGPSHSPGARGRPVAGLPAARCSNLSNKPDPDGLVAHAGGGRVQSFRKGPRVGPTGIRALPVFGRPEQGDARTGGSARDRAGFRLVRTRERGRSANPTVSSPQNRFVLGRSEQRGGLRGESAGVEPCACTKRGDGAIVFGAAEKACASRAEGAGGQAPADRVRPSRIGGARASTEPADGRIAFGPAEWAEAAWAEGGAPGETDGSVMDRGAGGAGHQADRESGKPGA